MSCIPADNRNEGFKTASQVNYVARCGSFAGRKQEEEAIRDQEEILRTAREIQGYRKKLTENSAAAVKLEQQEAALAPWLKLDIPMNFSGTAKAAVLVGSIDGNITLDQVYSQLAADAPQLEAFDIQEISNDAGKLSLVVVCLKTQAQEMEEALRMQGFARPAQLVSEVPAQELENLKNEVVRIQEESEQIREQIRDLHDRKNSLQLVSDYFRIRAQKYEVLGQLRQSESTFCDRISSEETGSRNGETAYGEVRYCF